MVLGKGESWEESTSPCSLLRVENGQRSIYQSVFNGLGVMSRSGKCFFDRLNRALREAKSTPPNFLPSQETSNSYDSLLSMQRSVRSRCHQRLNDLPEEKQAPKFALTLSTQVTSVCLCASRCSLWPLFCLISLPAWSWPKAA